MSDDDTLRRLSDDDALDFGEEQACGDAADRELVEQEQVDETLRRLSDDKQEEAVGEEDKSAADTGA